MKSLLIQPDNVYMIRHTRRPFFLYDCMIGPELDAVLWTPNFFKAREFYTEESVEMYKYIRLVNRPCEIIMIK